MKRAASVPKILCLALLVAGCRSRADYELGTRSYREGNYREAYLHFWEACQQSPSTENVHALLLAGQRVAGLERQRGIVAEAAGDIVTALTSYSLALEYDPLSPAAREDHARAWAALEQGRALEGRLLAARLDPSVPRGWTEVDLLLDLLALPFRAEGEEGGREQTLRRAVRATVDARLRPLRRATFEEPLPPRRADLHLLKGLWVETSEDLRARVLAEEDASFSPSLEAREVASWGVLREELRDPIIEAESAVETVALALEAVDLLERGASAEASGDAARAIEAYGRACLLHSNLDVARDGRLRALGTLLEYAFQTAVLALRGRDWQLALEHLEKILRFLPDHAEALELRATARRELSSRHALDARRYEDSGLYSNALVRYYLASSYAGADEALEASVRRLEGAIAARLRPRLHVTFRSVDSEELRVRRDLWGIDGDVLARLDREIEIAAQTELDLSFDRRFGRAPGPAAGKIPLVIEDLDYSYVQGDPAPGVEVSRYVESLRFCENPVLSRAEDTLRSAREDQKRSLEGEAEANRVKKPIRAEEVLLANLREKQAAAFLSSLPRRVPAVAWASSPYSAFHVRLRVELAARYRLEGETRWVTSSLETYDRVVEGDPGRGIAPDPQDFLSRGESLRVLAPRLGRSIALDAEDLIRLRQERFYREGLDRLAAHSFDVATENLVVFLYSRRGQDDAQVRDAARKLKDLTGCDLLELWKS